jgi:hypothetical protein
MNAAETSPRPVVPALSLSLVGTCRTRLLGGDADHRDLVLTDAERADHIMLCVSLARAGELVLDR